MNGTREPRYYLNYNQEYRQFNLWGHLQGHRLPGKVKNNYNIARVTAHIRNLATASVLTSRTVELRLHTAINPADLVSW